MLRLRALNCLRWLREYLVVWGLLSFIYSLTVTLILQPILEKVLARDIAFSPLWAATCALLIVPGLLEALELPPVSFRFGRLTFMPRGVFSERIWARPGGSLGRLYLRHDLRRGATWLVVALVAAAGGMLPERRHSLWVLAAQIPVQRALYSIHKWRGLALAFQPRGGARALLGSVLASQLIQFAIGWLALGIMSVGGGLGRAEWLALGAGGLGAVVSSAAMALEGDSGRPWIVNFVALTAGTLGGFACLISPWFLALVVYFGLKMFPLVDKRLQSVEHLDEDTVIS